MTAMVMALMTVSALATTPPADDAVSVITPMVSSMKTDILAVAAYVVPIGFGIFVIFWAIRFAKKQIAKNAH
jgi:hypothetical protein